MRLENGQICPRFPTRLATIAQVRQAASHFIEQNPSPLASSAKYARRPHNTSFLLFSLKPTQPANDPMNDHDFHHAPDRRHGGSIKWDRYAGQDILPMWVADMDFAAPPAIREALIRHISHGDLGYGHPPSNLAGEVIDFLAEVHGWHVDPDWIIWLPGLVSGLNLACHAFGESGVITQTPVYPPFLSAPGHAGTSLTTVPLLDRDTGWSIDHSRLATAAKPNQLLLLCNPHNPVGSSYSAADLAQLADMARHHDMIVCADEIHADLLLDRQTRHIPFASQNADAAARTVTLMSPSKTFNIPGLGGAFAIAANSRLRHRLQQQMAGIVPHPNRLAWIAMQAAYGDSRDWYRRLLDYLRGNLSLVSSAIDTLPAVRMHRPQATYLAWIDCRQLAVANPHRHFEHYGLGLSDGTDFGAPGFLRLNFGCPRSRLLDSLQRLERAVLAAGRV